MYEATLIHKILAMYINGVAILDIAAYLVDYDVNPVNKILDDYIPYLE